jgi:pimeloyl-ACP methyl ester carboxylesterase
MGGIGDARDGLGRLWLLVLVEIMARLENLGQEPSFETVVGPPALQLRHMAKSGGHPVLCVHGATIPSAVSFGYRFADGLSWEDSLCDAGFDVWMFDFEGYGGSAAPLAYDKPASERPIPVRATDAAQQIAHVVQHILKATGHEKLSIIAHAWGTIPAALYVIDHAETIERLVLFAPAMRRQATPESIAKLPDPAKLPAWRRLTVAEQLERFVNDTPKDAASVLAEPTLDRWGPAWLATDPTSTNQTPPAVRVPGGPFADIIAKWTGSDLYDLAQLTGDILLVHGEWDSGSTAAEADNFKSRASNATVTIRSIPKSGHFALLETNRSLLWDEVNGFLGGLS